MINLYVSGVDRTNLLRVGSLNVESQLQSRDQASFNLVSRDASYRPVIGAPVIITDAGTTIAGTPATFSRPSAATVDGLDYTSGTPRYTGGGLLVEEGTTNGFTNTDGVDTTYTRSGVTNSPGSITNFSNAVSFGDNSVVRYGYKSFVFTAGVTYVFSAYVLMDDGSAPRVGGQTSSADLGIVLQGSIRSNTISANVTLVGGSLYRVSLVWTPTVTGAGTGSGIIKYTQMSSKGFKVTGYQIEQKSYMTSYAESGATSFTRSAESLTIPASGFTQGGWTSAVTVKRSTTDLAGSANTLWECQIDANNLWRLRLTAAGILEAVIVSGGTTYSATTTATIASGVASRIAWCGDGTTALVAVNGMLVASFSYVEPIGTVPASISIGSGVSAVYSDLTINTRALDSDALEALTLSTPSNVTSAWSLASSLNGLNAQRIFGGTIDAFNEMLTIDGSASLDYDVEAVSYDALLDNRLVARSYETPGQTLRDIVTDIIANEYPSDGINTDNVATGPEIEPIKFNYDKASECFDDLAELTGYTYWIDPYKNLYFVDRATLLSPVNFLESVANWQKVTVERTRETYRNRQFIKAGLGLTPLRTEYFVGDGTRKSFTLAYPAGKEPSPITVGGVSKTVGIREVESGKNWYWQKNSPVVNQDDGDSAVTAGTQVAVTYQGQYPILVSAQSDPGVADRVLIEGGSGFYDSIEDQPNIDTVEAAQERASGLLRKFGRIPQKATITHLTAGCRAGQLATVTIPTHNLTGQWLIESVSLRDYNGQRVQYVLKLLDGEAVGGWQGFFGALKREARKIEFQDNEVILILRSETDTVLVSDSHSVATAALVAPLADFAVCGFSELTS